MENRIKVLIADGSEAFCGHLKSELQQLDGYDLVGTAADGRKRCACWRPRSRTSWCWI